MRCKMCSNDEMNFCDFKSTTRKNSSHRYTATTSLTKGKRQKASICYNFPALKSFLHLPLLVKRLGSAMT